MEVEDEKFERPESVGSIGKVLEQVKFDTTPRDEKELYFDSPQEGQAVPKSLSSTAVNDKHSLSFKQFIVEGGPHTPDTINELEARSKQLHINTNLDQFEEPKTPTQRLFSI